MTRNYQLSAIFLSCFPLYFYLLLVLEPFYTQQILVILPVTFLPSFFPLKLFCSISPLDFEASLIPTLFSETASQRNLELSDSVRLADKKAPGILLFLSLQFWNYRPALPHPVSTGVLGIQTWIFMFVYLLSESFLKYPETIFKTVVWFNEL